jgi:dihydrofolate synthase/folylpolyglutamate synthase
MSGWHVLAEQSRAKFERAELARVEKILAGRFPHKMLPDISRMRTLVDLLGHPEQAYPTIHLTGTNGKTSTARMIDTLLRAFGLRTGRYTSPHLEKVTERISIDGQPASSQVFVQAYDDVADFVAMVDAQSDEQVTFFELLTAMAFSAFADTPIEVGVIEVGMGGTWDATNVIDSLVQVITPISLDHRELGDTVAEVATDKSGILRAGGTAIFSSQSKEAAAVLLKKAAELEMTIAREGLEFGVADRTLALGGQLLSLRGLGGEYGELFLPLHGAHQAHNAAAALAAVEAFLGAGEDGPLDIDTVRVGFAAMDSPGRLETIRSSPTIILDGAHNPAGARALATALAEDFAFDRLVGVVSILSDKDVGAILSALEPVLSSIVVTQNSSPRAMTIDELANEAVEIFGGDRVDVEPRLDDALDAAVRMAEDDTPLGGSGVIVTGSLVTVGEARRLLTHGG